MTNEYMHASLIEFVKTRAIEYSDACQVTGETDQQKKIRHAHIFFAAIEFQLTWEKLLDTIVTRDGMLTAGDQSQEIRCKKPKLMEKRTSDLARFLKAVLNCKDSSAESIDLVRREVVGQVCREQFNVPDQTWMKYCIGKSGTVVLVNPYIGHPLSKYVECDQSFAYPVNCYNFSVGELSKITGYKPTELSSGEVLEWTEVIVNYPAHEKKHIETCTKILRSMHLAF